MKINLDDCKRRKTLQEERVVALYLAEMINTLCNRKQFEHQEETTLDLYWEEDDSDTEEEENDKIENNFDYEFQVGIDQQKHQLSNYTIEFMQ